jgi:hypothetical protein
MRSTAARGNSASDAELPSAEVRGFIGLALFIHLFAVAVALTSYTFPSPLQERLRQVFGPYIGTLNFDLQPNVYPSGRFYLTHGLESDVDFVVEVLVEGASEPVTVPLAGLWPGERRRRYQALANAAGALASGEEPEPMLLRSIAGSILKQSGASRGSVRALAHKLLPIEAIGATDPAARDPFSPAYYNTVYEAYVLVSSTGQVDLLKKSAAGEVAPVERGP